MQISELVERIHANYCMPKFVIKHFGVSRKMSFCGGTGDTCKREKLVSRANFIRANLFVSHARVHTNRVLNFTFKTFLILFIFRLDRCWRDVSLAPTHRVYARYLPKMYSANFENIHAKLR